MVGATSAHHAMPSLRIAACAAIALSLPMAPATSRAHSAASILGVLGDDAAPVACEVAAPAPRAVLTSIGPAWAEASGAWAIGCATDYDRADALLVAATDDLQALIAVADGALFASDDAGCSLAPVQGEPGYATTVAAAGSRRFALTRDDAQSRVVEVVDGAAVERGAWPREGADGFVADAVEAVVDRGTTWLVVTGARPTPGIWLGRSDGGDVAWRSVGGAGFDVDVQRIAPRGLTPDGPPWLLETTAEGRRLHAPAPGQSLEALWELPDGRWEAPGPPATSVHGPVPHADGWLAVVDGAVWHAPTSDPTSHRSLGDAGYTCLARAGGATFACDLYTLWHVPEAAASVADATAVLSTNQLGPTRDACVTSTERADVCDGDWIHYAAENGWLETAPALCPGDARREATDDADAGGTDVSGDVDAADPGADADAAGRADSGGCGAGGAAPASVWWLLAILGWRRRGRP